MTGRVREIHADTYAAISDPAGFFPIVLAYVDWPDAPIRVHTNRGDISWDGETWAGIGNISDIALPADRLGMAAQEAAFSLRGVGDDLDDYLEDDPRGRVARFWFCAVTERDGSTLIGEPFLIFSGAINGLKDLTEFMEIGYSRGAMVPLVSGPSQRSSYSAFHSHEDQNALYPADTAGRFLINIEREAERLRWPA
ncbi:MAG: hypothetical protein EP318_15390 [Rhodobacteraceae bacterium]|nr:MAG: hypothetical protein EP318_15390 [Paracoccaceae bacterium]